MSRSKSFKMIFFLSIVVVMLAAIGIVSTSLFSNGGTLDEGSLIEVKRGTLARSVVATGSITPVTEVEVKSKASGLVEALLVEEGDMVDEGQILVQLDKELLSAQLREAEASLAAVRARLDESRAEHSSALTMKKKMYLDVRNLEDALRFREKEVARYRAMSEEAIISKSELDKTEREHQEAYLKLESLKSELLMQDARIEAAEKATARMHAEVSQAEAARDRVVENLRYATITSPIRGRVLKRNVEVGDAVSSILQLGSQATLLMTLGDMSQVFVEGRVDESDIGQVFEGQEARVRVDAFRSETFPGGVMRISPLGEEKDNVIGFKVRVSIEDPKGILRANMSANAEIVVEEKQDVLLIPESSIIYDKDRNTFAEIFDSSAPESKRRVQINIGISNGTTTEVVSGLAEGDRLIPEVRGLI